MSLRKTESGNVGPDGPTAKRKYVKPAILTEEKLEVIAVDCTKIQGAKNPGDPPFVCPGGTSS